MNFSESVYLNFHAHQQMPAEEEIVIQSHFLQENLITKESDKIFYTAGLHPWHADILSENEVESRLIELIGSERILAVGETGLDKLKGPDLTVQQKIFYKHAEIAEKYRMPLIVHSVKAHNEILKIKIDLKSDIPWVIHHFNGSKQQAFDFTEHGFYLSLSHHITNSRSRVSNYLKTLPLEKIFLETDDFNVDIKKLYDVAANKFDISIEMLKRQLIDNLKNLLNG